MKVVHFSFDNKYNTNIGDQAHVIAIQESLQRHSSVPIEFIDRPIKLLGAKLIPSLKRYPGAKHYPKFIQELYRRLIGYPNKKLLNDCNKADLIIVGGGGVFMSQFLPFNNSFIDKIETPIVLFGVGYNQNIKSSEFTPTENQSARKFANKASLITVRDKITFEFLQKINVSSCLMSDPAIFLTQTDDGSITENTFKIRVGINLAHHGWEGQDEYTPLLIKTYVSLMKVIANTYTDVGFVYFMHEPGEQYVLDLFSAEGLNFADIIRTTDSRQLKAEYGKVDIVVSMMLHSTVLAFGAGVPCISIGYDKKNASFMQLTKQENRYISIESLNIDNLVNIFMKTIDDIDHVKRTVRMDKRKLQSIYDFYLDKTLALASMDP